MSSTGTVIETSYDTSHRLHDAEALVSPTPLGISLLFRLVVIGIIRRHRMLRGSALFTTTVLG